MDSAVRFQDHSGRTAVVGLRKRQQWGTRLSGLFHACVLRLFSTARADEAWDVANA